MTEEYKLLNEKRNSTIYGEKNWIVVFGTFHTKIVHEHIIRDIASISQNKAKTRKT